VVAKPLKTRAKPKIPIAGLKLGCAGFTSCEQVRAKPKIPIAGLKLDQGKAFHWGTIQRAKPKIPIAGLKLSSCYFAVGDTLPRKTQNPDRGTET